MSCWTTHTSMHAFHRENRRHNMGSQCTTLPNPSLATQWPRLDTHKAQSKPAGMPTVRPPFVCSQQQQSQPHPQQPQALPVSSCAQQPGAAFPNTIPHTAPATSRITDHRTTLRTAPGTTRNSSTDQVSDLSTASCTACDSALGASRLTARFAASHFPPPAPSGSYGSMAEPSDPCAHGLTLRQRTSVGSRLLHVSIHTHIHTRSLVVPWTALWRWFHISMRACG